MDLALFDFDGTITTKGTYPGFVFAAVRRRRQLVGGVALSPMLAAYKCGLLSDRHMRKVISWVGFRGDELRRVQDVGAHYASAVLPTMIRPVARERLAWHAARGDRIVVVSASLDVYLEPWCRSVGVDVICTTLEARDGRLTGRCLGGDCTGDEKVRRIRERYALTDFEAVYAYGDSEEDRQMLDLATRKYFRWQEVPGGATGQPSDAAR